MFLTNTGFKYSGDNFHFLRFYSNRLKKNPKTLLKAYLTSQTVTGLFLNCLFIQFKSKKNSVDYGIFAIAYATEVLRDEKVENLSCGIEHFEFGCS